jgi:hypothetical protein
MSLPSSGEGLFALIPLPMGPVQLKVSPVPEIDPAKVTPDGVVGEVAWVSGATVATNARRVRTQTRRTYRSLADGNVGSTPPESNPLRWFDEGPTNRWAWADGLASTATVAASPAVWEIEPGAATALELFGLVGVDDVRLQIFAPGGGALQYDQTLDSEQYSDPDPHWQLYFEAPRQGRSVSFAGLDIAPGARCVVTVTNRAGGSVAVGLMAFGSYTFLGCAEFGFKASWRNYARETVDDYGNEVYVPGKKAKDLSGSAVVSLAQANAVADALDGLLDVGAIYMVGGRDELKHMKTWGRLQPASIEIAAPTECVVSVDIRGKI